MNKIKKITMGIIVILITLLGLSTSVEAKGTEITWEMYAQAGSSFLCAQRSQAFEGKQYYDNIGTITIEGMTSTAGGVSVTDKLNAQLAYILSKERVALPAYQTVTCPAQNAFWIIFYDWCHSIGYKHNAVLGGNYSHNDNNATTRKYGGQIYQESIEYANNLEASGSTEIKDNGSQQNLTTYDKDGISYTRVGPFNWNFSGKITEIIVKNQTGNPIQGVLYSHFNGTTEDWHGVDKIESGKEFYISVPTNSNTIKITGIQAKGKGTNNILKAQLTLYKANEKVYSQEHDGWAWPQNIVEKQVTPTDTKIEGDFEYDIPMLGGLKIIKINEDNEKIKLPGVGFIIQNKETGKYIRGGTANRKIEYVNTEAEAEEYATDANGEITIKDLIAGKYLAYEKTNPNEQYEIKEEPEEIMIEPGKVTNEKIGNKQIYVDLSGYVWLDKEAGKTSKKTGLFCTPTESDINDLLFNGITVRLKDKTNGGVVAQAVTAKLDRYKGINNGNGEYLFKKVLTEKLQDYYVEFEYDGLTYTNVPKKDLKQETATKAIEKATGVGSRGEFNQNFTTVEGNGGNTGFTTNAKGEKHYDLTYEAKKHSSTLSSNGKYTEHYLKTPMQFIKQETIGAYIITADTASAGYNLKDQYTPGVVSEIKYVNLGLNEREQPEMAVIKDLENVRLTINGYEHTYLYSQRFKNTGEYGDGFNVGVKYGSKYGNMSYRRAIYKSDYDYENPNDKSKELNVYVTYQIRMRNKSTNLTTKINNLVDYYDERYSIVDIGKSVDEKGNITQSINHQEVNYNKQGYKKVIINTNTILRKDRPNEDEQSIFVQFKLSREAVLAILNGREMLDNVVEINSYSIYSGNSIYAGIDKMSNPGNCEPWNTETYEADTDAAPSLLLETADAREMAGKVFLDETTGELRTGERRQGSGAYENGEKGIEGVDIILTENTGSGKSYTARTDKNGDFVVSGFIPGDYTLTYTWGDQTYTVQNYKGTVYNKERYDKNMKNKNWYKENVGTRLSDAIDNYQTRLEIDEEMKYLTNKITATTKTKMTSTTPTMGIGVEYEEYSMGDRYTYRISNIDFGIVERARQELALNKRIKTLKATLANGQVIANLTIDEDANGNRVITGDRNNITYMPPSQSIDPKNGFIRLELDNELIQGCMIEVGYEIKATNLSEVDYLSENYYKYGIIEGNPIVISPTGIIDYLDKDWAFDKNKNPQWTVKTLDEIKDLVATTVYDNEETTIEEKTILYTDSLKGYHLEPKQTAEVMLNVSKILTTTDEISLDNETEIVEITKTGGSKPIQSIPGNYVPGKGKTEIDDSMAETTIITPATGENRDYIGYTLLLISSLGILIAGVIFIKKRVLK